MAKARVATRVKAAVGGKKSHNQSQDLINLTEKYNVFAKRLQALIAALKAHYNAMQSIAKSRHQVAQHLAVLATGTPLFSHTGEMGSSEKPNAMSYLSIQEGVSGKANMYLTKYAQFVIDYAVEWEKVVSNRVTKGLKQAEQHRVELGHYQNKVESLRQSANATMAKGKQVDQKTSDRLTRNEEKLLNVRKVHSEYFSDLTILIDEVTDRSWRDLHPLLIKISQFEITLSGDEAKALGNLNTVVNELKRVAVTHGIKPQARLKELDTLEPSALSTQEPGNNILAIEAGVGGISLSGDLSSPSAGDNLFPAGAGTPREMGGFPVVVNSDTNLSNPYPMKRGTSMDKSIDGSIASGPMVGAPTTLDIMAINASAAPPPTVDQLSAAFGPGQSSNVSVASSGGGLPPFAPNSRAIPAGVYSRRPSSDSLGSSFSGVSGASAPPPAAPPPPPPPQQYRSPSLTNTNPFGPAPAAPPPAPSQSAYGTNPFGPGPPAPAPAQYGMPPSVQPPVPYGIPAAQTNPFGAAQTNPFGAAPAPMYGNAPQNYGQLPTTAAGYGQPPPRYPTGGGTNPFQ